jgi:hypothetical protein
MIETITIGSLCVMGLYAAMGEGMILEFLKKFFEYITNYSILRHIRPALYECPICMASIWGTTVWLLLGNWFSVAWALYVFAVAGLNYIIVNLVNRDE